MGKLAKPQRSKKHKKIKAVDPFYHGSRKDVRQEGWNQKPKDYHQEIPKKLKKLGLTMDGVRHGNVGKKSKNRFRKHPDAPTKYHNQFSSPLGAGSVSKKHQPTEQGKQAKKKEIQDDTFGQRHSKRLNKGSSPKLSELVVNDYIDTLKPTRSFVDPFEFKRRPNESEMTFMRRVNNDTNKVLTQSRIADKFEISDEKKMLMTLKTQGGMSEKKKLRLKEKKQRKLAALKEKKREKLLDFNAFKDKVVFGDTVHAPPELSVRPKKAIVKDVDRPGLRMPELKEAINNNVRESVDISWNRKSNDTTRGGTSRQLGESVKRKDLPMKQKLIADIQRENFIDAYRQMKKGRQRNS